MGRSGTTVVMEMLGHSGVYLDDVNWAQEHEAARAIDDPYLEARFGARRGLPYGRLPDEEIRVPEADVRERAAQFVAMMDENADGRPWAFKDPRVTVLHDLWLEHMDVVIGVFRRPDHVADSYLKQEWISGWQKRRTALRYWARFNQSLIHVLDAPGDFRRYLVETSPDLPEQLDPVLRDLGLTLGEQAVADFDPARQSSADVAEVHRRERDLYAELVRRRTVPRPATLAA